MRILLLVLIGLTAAVSNANACLLVYNKVWTGQNIADIENLPQGLNVFRGEVISVNPASCFPSFGQPCWVSFRVIDYLNVAPVFLPDEILHLKADGAKKVDGGIIEMPKIGTEAVFGFRNFFGAPELAFGPLSCNNTF